MDRIFPWKALSKVIKQYYPKPKGAGRRPIGIERMLRTHFLQHWVKLSDPGAEEALYDSRAKRQFVGIDLGKEPVNGLKVNCGTIVDETIIDAPDEEQRQSPGS